MKFILSIVEGKALLFLIVLALASTPLFAAETKTIVRETKGQGVNKEEAIKKALQQAVAQARGVMISSRDVDFIYRSASADIERKPTGGKRVEFDAVGVDVGGTALRTNVAGLVKTYEVLNERKINDNTYEVTLKVWVYDYEAPDKTLRLRLAVMPIKTLTASCRFGDLITPAWDVSRRFSQKLAVALTQTNKFAVLDREYIQEFAQEKRVLINDASLEELSKLGQVLGVDYMLVGTITEAGIEKKEKWSPAIGRLIREYEADFNFEYRLLVGPTRQLKLADVLDISLDKTDEIKKLVKEWEPQDLDYREMMDNFISMAANQVVETIIDRIYPIRIASINEDGQVIINQGGTRILKGQLLDIFSQGKELFDVDTKESLGTTEILIATVRIDKVTPRISYAKIIEGDLSKISEGLICRRKKLKEKTIEGRKSDIERTSEGGVKLPFD